MEILQGKRQVNTVNYCFLFYQTLKGLFFNKLKKQKNTNILTLVFVRQSWLPFYRAFWRSQMLL